MTNFSFLFNGIRSFSKTFFIVLVAFAHLSTQAQQKKNVLFIIADDLNCNLGSYGHYLVKTPNIDKLAKNGMLFSNAFCNYPLCGPSRGSIMTGLYPDQTGHYKLRDYIRQHVPDVITMSQNFMNQGYVAARVGKIYHYDNPNGIGTPGHDDSASWNERYYPRGIDKDIQNKIFTLRPNAFGATLSWLAAEGSDEDHTDGKVATKAIELLGKYKAENTPFFLGVGFYKPHTPFVAPAKYFDLYSLDDIRVPHIDSGYLATLPKPAAASLQTFKEQINLPDSLARRAIQAYYATISFLDAQVGKVLNALDSLGLRENTIIVFTSDHGYHMGEHGYYQKNTLFEDSDRIPMIVSYPGMKHKGRVSKSLIELIDLYPTLSELAGLETPKYISGRSFKKILEHPVSNTRNSALSQIVDGYTLRTERYRYTRWKDGGANMIELYDRRSDPAEMKNLAKDRQYKNIIAKLDEQLNKRIKQAAVPPEGLKVYKATRDATGIIQKKDNDTSRARPNVIYILADDMGYGDLSCYGQRRFSTPNIDRLAKEGIQFLQHYAGTSVCAPSRSVLMTGQHSGYTPIRGNKSTGHDQAFLPDSIVTVAEIFKQAGYATGAFGKWGLGAVGSEGDPNNQGFDEFYGFNSQGRAHSYYPDFLYHNQQKVTLEKNHGDKKVDYAPTLIHHQVMNFIDKNRKRPFFIYYPTTIPHAELVAPETYMVKFRGKYLPEKSYKGVVPGAPNYKKGGYESQPEGHAAFAAMISLLDDQVGEILDRLKRYGLDSNTIVIFTSDNGPHQEAGADPDYFDSNGPWRGYKRDLYEGGIREPMLARWAGHIAPGSKTGHLSAFWDVLPTVADLLDVPAPQNIQGISFLPTLTGKGTQEIHDYLYWEFHERGGRQAIRKGKWKYVTNHVLNKEKRTVELYDLEADPGETQNVASGHPSTVSELQELMHRSRKLAPLFPFIENVK